MENNLKKITIERKIQFIYESMKKLDDLLFDEKVKDFVSPEGFLDLERIVTRCQNIISYNK